MAYNEPAVTQLHPNTGALSLRQVIGDKDLGIQGLLPISRSGWFQGIREKRFPAGFICGKRRRMWLASDIAALLESLSNQGGAR